MFLFLGFLAPIISIIFGILILVYPQLLSILVGIYLIFSGIVGLVMRSMFQGYL